MISDRADAGRDSGADTRRLWGCPIQHEEASDDRAESSDEKLEMNPSEHWMMIGIRPFTELGLLPTDRTTSGTEDRPFATSSIVKLRIGAFRKKNEEKCERADAPNPHAFGTSGMSPAEQAWMPEASGDR